MSFASIAKVLRCPIFENVLKSTITGSKMLEFSSY